MADRVDSGRVNDALKVLFIYGLSDLHMRRFTRTEPTHNGRSESQHGSLNPSSPFVTGGGFKTLLGI